MSTEIKSKHLETFLAVGHCDIQACDQCIYLIEQWGGQLGVFKCMWYYYVPVPCSKVTYWILMDQKFKKQNKVNPFLHYQGFGVHWTGFLKAEKNQRNSGC